MKQWIKWIALVTMVFMLSGSYAMAANGTCQGSQNDDPAKNSAQAKKQPCKGAALRPCLLIINGEPVTITGTVYEALYAGQGLTVDTGEELVTVYGFGPQWYWDLLGVEKPDVGEMVEIEAVKVKFSDETEKIIAISITIGEDVVEFRDENGRPLWRCKGRLL